MEKASAEAKNSAIYWGIVASCREKLKGMEEQRQQESMDTNDRLVELEEVSGHLEWLQSLAVSIVADRQVAEDLVQHALKEATDKQSWQPGRLRGWLVGTTRNLALQHFRTESRRRQREKRVVEEAQHRAQILAGEDAAPGPDALAEQVESQKLLSTAVLDLPEPYRSTVLLFYYGELSQHQIALDQKVSVRTVETRLRRARAKLREQLEARFGKESWAMALLPLILRIPPPQLPPPVTAAGFGSLGAGWWTSGAIVLLGLGAWAWGDADQPPSGLQQVGMVENSPAESAAAYSTEVTRQEIPIAEVHKGVSSSAALPTEQAFAFVERGTGLPLADLHLHVSFLRAPIGKERFLSNHPSYYLPKDRIWWKLGDGIGQSDASGKVKLEIPFGATSVLVHLDTHSSTHSIEGYSIRYHIYPLKEIAGKTEPLVMVRRTGAAIGYVLDLNDNPVADALIDVYYDAPRELSISPTMTILAGVDGGFRVPNIACDQGGYRLRPHKSGYVAVRSLRSQRYAGFGVDYPGVGLILREAHERATFEVRDEFGVAVEGAAVNVSAIASTGQDSSFEYGTYLYEWQDSVMTDEDGLADIVDFPSGPLLWEVRHEGFLTWSETSALTSSRVGITLHRGANLDVLVRGPQGVVEGAVVGVYSKSMRRNGTTDVEGKVVFGAMPHGEKFHVAVTHPEHAFLISQEMDVSSDKNSFVADLKPGLSLTGHVNLELGEAIAQSNSKGVRVFIRPIPEAKLPELPNRATGRPDRGWWHVVGLDETLIQEDGSFEFHGLPDTQIEAWFGLRRRPLGFATAHAGESDVLLYPESGTADRVSANVHVFDKQSGNPVSTHYLFWTRVDLPVPETLPAVIVHSSEGRYRQVGLPTGIWALTAWAPQGFTTRRLAPQRLKAGQHSFEVPLTKPRSLRLRLIDDSGNALDGVSITAMDPSGDVWVQGGLLGGGFRAESFTDAAGEVALSQVPAELPFELHCRIVARTQVYSLSGVQEEAALHELVFAPDELDRNQ